MAGGGDLNFDGYDDIVASAIGANAFDGAALVYFGSPGVLHAQHETLDGPVGLHGRYGTAVAITGSFDRTEPAVVVGAPGESIDPAVYVHAGHVGAPGSPAVSSTGLRLAGGGVAGFGASVASAE